jgi:hypothetical protein
VSPLFYKSVSSESDHCQVINNKPKIKVDMTDVKEC